MSKFDSLKKDPRFHELLTGKSFTHPSLVIAKARAGMGNGDKSAIIREYVRDSIIYYARHSKGFFESEYTIAECLGYKRGTVNSAMSRCTDIWRDGYVWKLDVFWPRPSDYRLQGEAGKGSSRRGPGGRRRGGAGVDPRNGAEAKPVAGAEAAPGVAPGRSQTGAEAALYGIEAPEEDILEHTISVSLTASGGGGDTHIQPPPGGGGDTGPTRSTGQGLAPGVGKKPYSLFGDNPIPVRSRKVNSGRQEVDNG